VRDIEAADYSLLPCPFCGSGETYVREAAHWTGKRNVVISATIMHHCEGKPMQNLLQVKGKTAEDAALKWNTRVGTQQ
jgi:hypothetical protein